MTDVWAPCGGWNPVFSETQRTQAKHLFLFFKNKKGYSDSMAENMMYMMMFKQLYHGLHYSDEQEEHLRKALKPSLAGK
jgi:hypothetical protein